MAAADIQWCAASLCRLWLFVRKRIIKCHNYSFFTPHVVVQLAKPVLLVQWSSGSKVAK
jgi:hypothetical protein